MGPPETTIWEYPDGRRLLGRRDGGVSRGHPARPATAPPGLTDAIAVAGDRRDRSTRSPAMIITRSPLRITLGGGGTDLPSYYREHDGFLIAAAIDKYVYVTVMRPFTPGIYPQVLAARARRARSTDVAASDHPRGASSMLDFETPQIEITTLADIPAGTGLGSSGSFTTALLKALYAHRKRLHPSRTSSPSWPATSRSTASASRSASRTSTSPRTAASPASRSTRTTRVDAEPLAHRHGDAVRPRGQSAAVLHRLLAQRRQHPEGPEDAHASRATPTCSSNLHYVKELGHAQQARRWRQATPSASAS